MGTLSFTRKSVGKNAKKNTIHASGGSIVSVQALYAYQRTVHATRDLRLATRMSHRSGFAFSIAFLSADLEQKKGNV